MLMLFFKHLETCYCSIADIEGKVLLITSFYGHKHQYLLHNYKNEIKITYFNFDKFSLETLNTAMLDIHIIISLLQHS